jgi:hypothetical protein
MSIQSTSSTTRRLLSLLSLFFLLLNACSFSLLDIPALNSSTDTPASTGPTATPWPAALITFTVSIPSPLQPGEVLNLSVLDEITGLGLDPDPHPMQSLDAMHFSVTIPFPVNSVVKYRYVRQGTIPILENYFANEPVRYRMYVVNAPASVQDVVTSWGDSLFSGPSGRISGTVVSALDSSPLVNILMLAGGQQVLTDSRGRFSIEGLPLGTHNLVAYSLDGSYQVFQQGAVIEPGKTTQVNLSLTAATLVNVVFTLTVPRNTVSGAPVRLAGNLYQLGNTFGDLKGGMSTVASRMPVMTRLQDGRYSLSLMLPVGTDLRYKYTLGDGFWNAEHNSDGSFRVRQFIVPSSTGDVNILDTVANWQDGSYSPIIFEVTVPSNTPVSDIVSIQFDPLFGWTEPIPIWALGNNQWVYQLYSPLNMLSEFKYRYCRNDQCGVADDVQTAPGSLGRMVSSSLAPQDLQDTVTAWKWLETGPQGSVPADTVVARQGNFWAGVEFTPAYDPTWQAWMPFAIQNVKGASANWLVLDPAWSISWNSPFIFTPVPGQNALWVDERDTISRARAANFNVALFPQPILPNGVSSADTWWTTTPRTPDWWDSWFMGYAAFANYYADLAANSGAQAIILGGDWLVPAFPGGVLIDGNSSGVPSNAETRWLSIISDLRQRFSGQILWASSLPGGLENAPDFVRNLDGVYATFFVPLGGSSVDELTTSLGNILDASILPFQSALGKPVILAVAYPSTQNSTSASESQNTIFMPGDGQGVVDLQMQAHIYEAMMKTINQRDWVSGIVSRGWYPPVELQDSSASVNAKPAGEVLKYWYPRLLGLQ